MKKKRDSFCTIILLIGVIFLSFLRCDSVNVTSEIDCSGIVANFAANITPIFTQSCVTNCHTTGGEAEAYVILSGDATTVHANIMAKPGVVNLADPPASKLLRKSIGLDGHLGLAPLVEANSEGYKAIYCWINDGAQNN